MSQDNSTYILAHKAKIISLLSQVTNEVEELAEDNVLDYLSGNVVFIQRSSVQFIESICAGIDFIVAHSKVLDINEACVEELHTRLIGNYNPYRNVKLKNKFGAVEDLNSERNDCRKRILIWDELTREHLVFAESNDLLRLMGVFLIIAKYPGATVPLEREAWQSISNIANFIG